MERIETMVDVEDFLYSFINYEVRRKVPYQDRNYNLGFINEFLDFLGHPEEEFEVIHVAGTNGKGSVCFLLSRLLVGKSFVVGTYSSPHLCKINERIRVNTVPINDTDFVDACNDFVLILDQLHLIPSYFDALTAIAVLYFKKRKCRYVILETGMGGRLDSTNFAEKKLAIINSIGMDHQDHLGSNLFEIAQEKAGIIKQDNIVIIGKQKRFLYPLFADAAKIKNAVHFQYQKDFSIGNLKQTADGIEFDFLSAKQAKMTIEAGLLSAHQSVNVAIALFALQQLGIDYSEQEVNAILKAFQIEGRFHKVMDSPMIILDGAHNVQAIRMLRVNLARRYAELKPKVLIMGLVEGKDYQAILPEIIPFFDQIIICKIKSFKEDLSLNIHSLAKEIHHTVHYAGSFSDAITKAQDITQDESLIVVTGSFYLVAEALAFYR